VTTARSNNCRSRTFHSTLQERPVCRRKHRERGRTHFDLCGDHCNRSECWEHRDEARRRTLRKQTKSGRAKQGKQIRSVRSCVGATTVLSHASERALKKKKKRGEGKSRARNGGDPAIMRQPLSSWTRSSMGHFHDWLPTGKNWVKYQALRRYRSVQGLKSRCEQLEGINRQSRSQ
jgi:hypothetical protein